MAIDDFDIWQKCDECCCPPPERPPQRIVQINRKATSVAAEDKCKYPGNQVVTSRYKWWNFFFKVIVEQMMKVAVAYFLVLVIIQVSRLFVM